MEKELGNGHHAYWYPGMDEKRERNSNFRINKYAISGNFGIYMTPELARSIVHPE